MPVISCEKCGAKVSDQVGVCPYCQTPLSLQPDDDQHVGTLRKVVEDWLRPWSRLPRDEKVGIFLFVAMCLVFQVAGIFHVTPTFNGRSGMLLMLIVLLISVYFLKVSVGHKLSRKEIP